MLTDSIAVLLGCIVLSEGFNLPAPNESVIFACINKLNRCINISYMPHFTLYTLTTLLSAAIILVMGICLLVLFVPRDAELKNYRISRRLLAGAYMVLSSVGLWEVFGETDTGHRPMLMVFTLLTASYQALLFTLSTITLINIQYMTARRVWLGNVLPITSLGVVLFAILGLLPERLFYTLFYVMLGLYCLQLIYYVTVFIREYDRYLRRFDNFFSSDEYRRLRWIRNAFFMAACVGVAAVSSLFVSTLVYTIFTAAYTIFYLYFAVKYINYLTIFHRIAPVIVEHIPITPGGKEATEEFISTALNGWIEHKEFLRQDITLETLANSLATNQTYLSRYINSHYGQNFRSWINSLRIGESMRLLESDTELSLDEIAEQIGIPSRSTFFRQFTSVAGVTPAEYRRKVKSENPLTK